MQMVAVTGGMASGKSLVGSFLSELGVAVCECDQLAHEAIAIGTVEYDAVVTAFGSGVLDSAGRIDRRVLGDVVFSDPRKLADLNTIVHPRVKDGWKAWLMTQGSSRAAAVIMPLLFEVGEEACWDAVVCVASSDKDQLDRLAKRGLSGAEVESRLAAQMKVSEKMARATYVLYNAGTSELLKEQTTRMIDSVLEVEHGSTRE